jgi:Holliday junction DNA helicase RuvA
MIARLQGEVVEVDPLSVVLDVAGIGYRVAVSSTTSITLGSHVTLYTHLAVRENALDLYGFGTRDELRMFNELIKLPKIGPKTALQILSQASLEVLAHAIHTNDPVYLSKMSGVGKKSAEKIVAGLRDILGVDGFTHGDETVKNRDTDVIDALITLGYSQRDALEAVQKIPAELADTNSRIKYALKTISA